MKRFRSISPHDFAVLGEVSISTGEEVTAAVAKARAEAPIWAPLGVRERAQHMRRFLDAFSKKTNTFPELASREMGMPFSQSRADFAFALEYLGWYIDNAEKYLAPEVVYEQDREVHTVHREPYGVAAVIVPWNYPASNFVWGVGQHLLAGNTVIFKTSEEIPLCGKVIEETFKEAGFPEGVFNEVYGRGPVGALLARQDVDIVTFTGSSKTGESLYRTAAAGMKKIVMELGGSAPGIVFEDADLSDAIGQIYDARFGNAGQSCDALKRLLVHESVWDATVEKLADKLRMVVLGDPLNPGATMGPLVAKRQVELLERQVQDAVNEGALVVAGGKQPGFAGAYYEPTLLTNIAPDMRVWQEEVFGPVLPIIKFATEEEAVALANDTVYGLGAYVYSRDVQRAQRVAAQLKAGTVGINGVSYVRPQSPFGGYKYSGLGREHGRWGFEEVTQVKVVAAPKHA